MVKKLCCKLAEYKGAMRAYIGQSFAHVKKDDSAIRLSEMACSRHIISCEIAILCGKLSSSPILSQCCVVSGTRAILIQSKTTTTIPHTYTYHLKTILSTVTNNHTKCKVYGHCNTSGILSMHNHHFRRINLVLKYTNSIIK